MTAEQPWDDVRADYALLEAEFGETEAWGGPVPLLARLMREFAGNPVGRVSVTSANSSTPVGLTDNQNAKSCILYVTNSGAVVRTDGGVPVSGSDMLVVVGSYIYLTGQPTIKGFQFVAAGAFAATLVGQFFD
jgi:hypothetical protein